VAETLTASAPAVTPAPALDDTMLAMDVVDTLRHAERLVERELSGDDRRDALRRRLKEIYAGQGIEVPDRIIDQGVAALEENRFVYRPTAPSLSRGLARIYATRDRWARLIGLCLAGLLVLGSGYWFGVKLPHERRVAAERVELAEGLPKALQAARDRVFAATQVPGIRAQADRLLAEGRAAAAAGALTDGRTRLAALNQLQQAISQEYQIRIVSRPGEASGVWRVPDKNPNGRNFYLIVEAVDRNGKVVPVIRTSEEDGTTAMVTKWGQRVPQAEFERIRQEKLRDGLVGQPVIGQKRPGDLQPSFTVPVSGGTILKW
jgi:Family of unknown function (DUF6384)